MEIAIAIAICEIAFWLLLFGGMATRYWLRRRRLSTVLLAAIPLAALVLGGLTLLADDPEPLYGWFGTLGLICGGWLVFGPLWAGLASRTKARA